MNPRTEYVRKWRAANPERSARIQKSSSLRQRYGLSLDEYTRMFVEQEGLCKICRKPPPGRTSLHVDHDHKTNKVRGLLCTGCNTKVGSIESPLFAACLAYLKGGE